MSNYSQIYTILNCRICDVFVNVCLEFPYMDGFVFVSLVPHPPQVVLAIVGGDFEDDDGSDDNLHKMIKEKKTKQKTNKQTKE